jgi:hypothetical protein
MALSPPAVFSSRIGSGKPPLSSATRAKVLRQLSTPTAGSSDLHDQALRADARGRGGVLAQQLAAGDADPVVRRRDIQHVGRVDVQLEVAGLQRIRLGMFLRRLPALRVGQEELDRACLALGGGGDQIRIVNVRADDSHARQVTTHARRPDSQFAPWLAAGSPLVRLS